MIFEIDIAALNNKCYNITGSVENGGYVSLNLDRVIAVRTGKTVYRDGEACIKVFENGYSKADVLGEALNQARVEETGLRVPHVREVTTIDGKWAIVSDYIKGKTLADLIGNEKERGGKRKHIETFAELQLKVLSKTCPLLTLLRDKMSRKIDLADIDETAKYELHARLEGMPRHNKLCHGDFVPSNVIIDAGGMPYIIDWAHATQGNAAADAARTYLRFWLDGNIGGAEEYLDIFCEKSGEDKKYVQKWMPIVAASQSVKGNEKERGFLLSWVNVEDYQ